MLGLLVISYASSVRTYLAQRTQISSVRAAIAQRQQEIATAQTTIVRWSDPAYVEIAARERFGLVMPGEQLYYVVDDPGSTPATAPVRAPSVGGAPVPVPGATTWWSRVAGSVGAAGNAPLTQLTTGLAPTAPSVSPAAGRAGTGSATTAPPVRSAGLGPSNR